MVNRKTGSWDPVPNFDVKDHVNCVFTHTHRLIHFDVPFDFRRSWMGMIRWDLDFPRSPQIMGFGILLAIKIKTFYRP